MAAARKPITLAIVFATLAPALAWGQSVSEPVIATTSTTRTWLGTPSSANLASAVTGETGGGALVFGTSPTISGGSITGLSALSATFNIEGNPALGQVAVSARSDYIPGLLIDKIGNSDNRPHGVTFAVDGVEWWVVGMDYESEDLVPVYHDRPVSYHNSSGDLHRVGGTTRKIVLGANVGDPDANVGMLTLMQAPDNVAPVGMHFPRSDPAHTSPGNDQFDRIQFDISSASLSRSWIKWSDVDGDSAQDWRIGSILDAGFFFTNSGSTGSTPIAPGGYVAQFGTNGNMQIGSATGNALPQGPTAISQTLRLAASSGANLGFYSTNYPLRLGQGGDEAKLSFGGQGQTAGVWLHAHDGSGWAGGITTGTATLSTKAVLQSDSTTKGWLPPRMTSTQRDAITSVPEGLVLANTTAHTLDWYTGSAWASAQAGDADLTSWAAVTRASGFDAMVATPSGTNAAAFFTNETGSGNPVFHTSPTLVTPNIGAATGTSLGVGVASPTGGLFEVVTSTSRGFRVLQASGNPDYPQALVVGNVGSSPQMTAFNGTATVSLVSYGDAIGSFFGVTRTNYASLVHDGGNGLIVGTYESDPLILGTNNTARLTISGDGTFTLASSAVSIANLPTSEPATVGQLWRDAGAGNVIKVSDGP